MPQNLLHRHIHITSSLPKTEFTPSPMTPPYKCHVSDCGDDLSTLSPLTLQTCTSNLVSLDRSDERRGQRSPRDGDRVLAGAPKRIQPQQGITSSSERLFVRYRKSHQGGYGKGTFDHMKVLSSIGENGGDDGSDLLCASRHQLGGRDGCEKDRNLTNRGKTEFTPSPMTPPYKCHVSDCGDDLSTLSPLTLQTCTSNLVSLDRSDERRGQRSPRDGDRVLAGAPKRIQPQQGITSSSERLFVRYRKSHQGGYGKGTFDHMKVLSSIGENGGDDGSDLLCASRHQLGGRDGCEKDRNLTNRGKKKEKISNDEHFNSAGKRGGIMTGGSADSLISEAEISEISNGSPRHVMDVSTGAKIHRSRANIIAKVTGGCTLGSESTNSKASVTSSMSTLASTISISAAEFNVIGSYCGDSKSRGKAAHTEMPHDRNSEAVQLNHSAGNLLSHGKTDQALSTYKKAIQAAKSDVAQTKVLLRKPDGY